MSQDLPVVDQPADATHRVGSSHVHTAHHDEDDDDDDDVAGQDDDNDNINNNEGNQTRPVVQVLPSSDNTARIYLPGLGPYPIQTAQNLQSLVLFCLALFIFVIWMLRREKRLKEELGSDYYYYDYNNHAYQFFDRRTRVESNMSSSMDDSTHSITRYQQRQGREVKTDRATKREMRNEMYQSLRWADEDEDEVAFRWNSQQQHARTSSLLNNSSEQQSSQESVVLHGPYTSSMVYHTWTPPPAWAEAARRVFPKDVNSLRRTLKLNLLQRPPTLTIGSDDEPKKTATHNNNNYNNNKNPGSRDDGDEQKNVFSLNVNEFSIHPTPPTEGGVLEVYIKNSPKSEWMENTFQSAQAAAQFQTDLLATQLMGTAIQNMYHVFRLIHQGSIAHEAPEFVLHDKQNVDTSRDHLVAVGVAWDDLMRCFGSTFPHMRNQLEDVWWNETKPRRSTTYRQPHTSSGTTSTSNASTPQTTGATAGAAATTTATQGVAATGQANQPTQTNETTTTEQPITKTDAGMAECSPEYINKRLILGPVDFFRLFVPSLPVDALPYTTSDVQRMEHLLRWRKRVARASLLVQSYARARQLVNLGWKLSPPETSLSSSSSSSLPEGYMKSRLSYDMNMDNRARDKVSRNEYYEPYVSRDVFCRVRGVNFRYERKWWNFTRQEGESVMSLGQAFSLIGIHAFSLPSSSSSQRTNRNSSSRGGGMMTMDHRLNAYTDPIESIPSLREMIESNRDVEFFVLATHSKSIGIICVHVYARNIPIGVDPSFDNAWDRFKAGDEVYRKQRLEFMFQLDLTTFTFPFLQAIYLQLFAFLLWLLDIKGFVSQSSRYSLADRFPLPHLRAEHYGQCHHFGGALPAATDSNRSPMTNYVAVNCDGTFPKDSFPRNISFLLSLNAHIYVLLNMHSFIMFLQ